MTRVPGAGRTNIWDTIQPVLKIDLGGLYAAHFEGVWH